MATTKTKQPKYTTFLLFKAIADPEALDVMMAELSEAQIEGREPMADVDVAFIEDFLTAKEENDLGMGGPLFS